MADPTALSYGSHPLYIELRPEDRLVLPRPCGPGRGVRPGVQICLQNALARPIGSPPLEELAAEKRRILVILSDDTRDEPREAFLDAIVPRLPESAELRLALATGTHGPSDLSRIDLGAYAGRFDLINHDGHRPLAEFRLLGNTQRGTPLRVHPALVEADLVIATGSIRPHYFAGFGAGSKALFPGLGENGAIRTNHLLKGADGARPGVVQGNPCREDLEELLDHLPGDVFLLNGVASSGGGWLGAVAGCARQAFRHGAELCTESYLQRVPRSSQIVVSGPLPLSGSLYQACKMIAAVAPVAGDNATIVLAAECPRGTGPVATVNQAIYELGIAPRLGKHRIILVSAMSRDEVAPMFCEFSASLEEALSHVPGPRLVVPDASRVLLEEQQDTQGSLGKHPIGERKY